MGSLTPKALPVKEMWESLNKLMCILQNGKQKIIKESMEMRKFTF